jgi:hypothetical protein
MLELNVEVGFLEYKDDNRAFCRANYHKTFTFVPACWEFEDIAL